MATQILNKLIVPKEQNAIYTAPALSAWPSLVSKNREITANHISSISDHRQELFSIAIDYTKRIMGKEIAFKSENPIIATGHQPNWHHCGVFIKSQLGNMLAKKLNASFLHIVLDLDTCNTALSLPIRRNDSLFNLMLLEISKNNCNISQETLLPGKNAIDSFLKTILKYCPQNALCNTNWQNINLNHLQTPCKTIADLITYLQNTLYNSFGVNAVYLPVSLLSESKAFHNFITKLLLDFISFVEIYNKAISKSNHYTGIFKLCEKKIGPHTYIEFPLWLANDAGQRTTLLLALDANSKLILATEFEVLLQTHKLNAHAIIEILEQKGYLIRPKAILLTSFIRLYLSDWFIHGVGGARYESITDYILTNYFDINGLKYGAASLTSHLFEAKHQKLKLYKNDLQQKDRAISHSPEYLLDKDLRSSVEVQQLIKQKKNAVVASRDKHLSSGERQKSRSEIEEVNQQLQYFLPHSKESILEEIAAIKKSIQITKNREFFFGLFPHNYLYSFLEVINAEL